MSSRAGLRFLQSPRLPLRSIPRKQSFGRRFQSSTAGEAPAQAAAHEAADKVTPPSQNVLQRLWHSPVGMKTVHFWAPVMKWGLVLAGISDFARPAESLSLTQNLALTATGAIWTRWCFVIKPRNVFLAAVNFFLGCVGVTQVSRIFLYQQSLKNETAGEVAKDSAIDAKDTAKGIAQNPESAAKEAVR